MEVVLALKRSKLPLRYFFWHIHPTQKRVGFTKRKKQQSPREGIQ